MIGFAVLNLLIIGLLLLFCLLTMVGFPGNWLIFFTAVAYGAFQGFTTMTGTVIAVLLALIILAELLELGAGALGAKRKKAHKMTLAAATAGSVLGAIAGTGMLPIIGSLIGAFAGGFVASYGAEYYFTGSMEKSEEVARGVFFAQVLAAVVKTIIAITLVIIILFHLTWT